MEADGVGHAVLNGVVRGGPSEELTPGQRHAGGEGVSHASVRAQQAKQGPQQVQRP